MKSSNIKVVGETFQKIADIVTPTMGAQGRLAIIAQDMDKPVLTDDGVTVARTALSLEGFERVPAISMIEAASNTEKEAYDGTTLTVLLVNEFYKLGMHYIKHRRWHPQMAANEIENFAKNIIRDIRDKRTELEDNQVSQLATITTKIPAIGDIVYEAYKAAGKDMNVVIEHDMKETRTKIEHTSGLILNSGYMSDVMRNFCNENSKTVYENAKLVLLAEDLWTQTQIIQFFKTIPASDPNPLVFFVTPKFNPESLKILLDALVPNSDKIQFQFVFLNEDATDELYLDIAAYTNGYIQDAALGTSEYRYNHCGTAEKIVIEREKTTIIASGDTSKRIESYKQMLEDHAYELSINTEASIRRRLSNLQTGLVKIKLACPTVTEYMTIKLKLDDAIGAVRKAFDEGILPGAGKAMQSIAASIGAGHRAEKKLLAAPMKQILANAGYSKLFRKTTSNPRAVVDVKSGAIVDAINAGIIDSCSSISTAVKNAASIAASYIKAYVIITR